MTKIYRMLQQWNDWLAEPVGQELLALEMACLSQQLASFKGQNALLLGVPAQLKLLEIQQITYPIFTTSLSLSEMPIAAFESDLTALPVTSGAIDLVIVSHMLDYTTHPHQLLLEACRIVRPGGYIAMMGFNPHSLWGLKKTWMKDKACPWNAHFLSVQKIVKWLRLAEFSLMKQDRLWFRPPYPEKKFFQQLKFLEIVGKKLYKPFGGIYFLLAQAKVTPLTPIRMKWKQGLKNFQPSGLIGSIGRVIL